MKPSLLVLLSLCVFVAAMVPRHRRALNTEDDQKNSEGRICAATTPCGWTVYKQYTKITEFSMNNNYCTCGPGTVCEFDEDDENGHVYIHRCHNSTETHDS